MGYVITSTFLMMLDIILDSGFDVLIGLDPIEGNGANLENVKKKFQSNRKTIWGRVSESIKVENGSKRDTEKAVIEALKIPTPGGGFMLSCVDNVSDNTENAWRNTYKLTEI